MNLRCRRRRNFWCLGPAREPVTNRLVRPGSLLGNEKTHFLFLPWIVILPLAFLWFVLINHLRVERMLNPPYSYGWAVPFLCAYLLWRNLQNAQPETRTAECKTLPSAILGLLLAGFAILYAPTRLIQEANPDWRLISWTQALEVIGITLCVLGLALRHVPRSTLRLSRFLFPVGFFLVAVPWPSTLEQSVIQDSRAPTPVPPPNCLVGSAWPPCSMAMSSRWRPATWALTKHAAVSVRSKPR